MLRPLRQARAGVPRLDMSIKGAFVLVPFLVVIGAAYLIGGESFRYRDTSVHPPKGTRLGWIVIAIAMAFGGICSGTCRRSSRRWAIADPLPRRPRPQADEASSRRSRRGFARH